MSFNAPNFLVTKVVLESNFSKDLENRAPLPDPADGQPGDTVGTYLEREIGRYSILSGFLSGTWGLILPFVVDSQIRDVVGPPQAPGPGQQAQQAPAP